MCSPVTPPAAPPVHIDRSWSSDYAKWMPHEIGGAHTSTSTAARAGSSSDDARRTGSSSSPIRPLATSAISAPLSPPIRRWDARWQQAGQPPRSAESQTRLRASIASEVLPRRNSPADKVDTAEQDSVQVVDRQVTGAQAKVADLLRTFSMYAEARAGPDSDAAGVSETDFLICLEAEGLLFPEDAEGAAGALVGRRFDRSRAKKAFWAVSKGAGAVGGKDLNVLAQAACAQFDRRTMPGDSDASMARDTSS